MNATYTATILAEVGIAYEGGYWDTVDVEVDVDLHPRDTDRDRNDRILNHAQPLVYEEIDARMVDRIVHLWLYNAEEIHAES